MYSTDGLILDAISELCSMYLPLNTHLSEKAPYTKQARLHLLSSQGEPNKHSHLTGELQQESTTLMCHFRISKGKQRELL